MTRQWLAASLWLPSCLVLLSAARVTASDESTEPAEPPLVSYYQDIRPIFQANCHGCHQPAKSKGRFVMTQFARLLAGGDGGEPAIVPGAPDSSLLVELITPIDGEAEMPDKGSPLKRAEIDLVRRWIAAGAIDDTPANAQPQYDLAHPPKYDSPPIVTALDYSADGLLLAVSGYHEVLIHDVERSTLVARLVGLSARIESIRFSPDGTKLAVTGGLPARMGEVQVWDTRSWNLELSVPVTFDTVYGACWSPDGQRIAFGCGDNTLRAIDAKSGEQVLFSGASSDWTLDTVFSTDGSYVISVGRDMAAKLTEVKTQRFIDNITSITPGALKGGLAAVARHPSQEEVLVGGADGTPQIYRVHREVKRVIGDNSNLLRSFPAMPGRIFDLGYRADGKRIAAGSSLDGRGHVHIYASDFDGTLPKGMKEILEKVSTSWSDEERQKLEEFRRRDIERIASASFNTPIYSLCWHPNQRELAVAGADGLVRILDAENASLKRVLMSAPVQSDRAGDLVAITVDPPSIEFVEKYGSQQLIVTGWLASGDSVDLTRRATYELSAEIVAVTAGMVRPLADGEARLEISHGGQVVELPVTVTGRNADFEPSFIRDVGPVISKLGCNGGSCHGSKQGKNGFKLSLRGYDPIFDVRAFADDHAGRRVNFAAADDSLMLLKATGSVPHEGGMRLKFGSGYYQILRDWIAAGCALDRAAPRVTRIELTPINPVVEEIGGEQQLRVTASYNDGSSRDVTAEAFVTSGDTEIATCSASGLITTLRRGEAPLMARFEGAYSATTLTVMGDRSGFSWQAQPIHNQIDELVAAKWQRMKMLPSELSTDAEFLRRVTLDLTGLPPTPERVIAFVADDRDPRAKRDEVIDALIGSEGFVVHWGNRWADLLQVNGKFLGSEGAESFRRWIRQQVEENTPYDQMVYEILTASGSTKDNPAASYFKILRTPSEAMENTTQLFLATRFNCNKCHDHPFERWTQDQYYELAAFFADVHLEADPRSGKNRVGGSAIEESKPLYEIVSDPRTGEVRNERTGEVSAPAFPYAVLSESGPAIESQEDPSKRQQLAAWLTSPGNRHFARSYVNRVWGYLLGIGLIDPLDDIRAGNPPSNPELLDWLTADFVRGDFDVRRLIATICRSRTYQLSIVPNEWNQDDRINYAHALPRRLPAEVLYDSIHLALGAKSKIPGVPEGIRASALPDVGIELQDGFLATLGRPARESACECERSNELGLGSVMALVTGPTVDQAISDSGNAITKLVESQADDSKLIEDLYLRILNRPATQEEVDSLLRILEELEQDHLALRSEFEAYQKEAVLVAERRADLRSADIEGAKIEVAAYEEEIAPREAELDEQQRRAIARAVAEEEAYGKILPEKLLEWEEARSAATSWKLLALENPTASNGATLTIEEDGSVFASGKDDKSAYQFTAKTDLTGVTAIRLEALADSRLPERGPGRARNGNFVLTEFEIVATPAARSDSVATPTQVGLQNARADFSQDGFDVAAAIDGKVDNAGWASSPKLGVDRTATFELKEPITEAGVNLAFTVHFNYGSEHTIGRVRICTTASNTPVDFGLPVHVTTILETPRSQRSEGQQGELLAYFADHDPGFQEQRERVTAARAMRPVDPKLVQLRGKLARVEKPLPEDPKLKRLERAMRLSDEQLQNRRVTWVQDVAWALINSPAFLFNH